MEGPAEIGFLSRLVEEMEVEKEDHIPFGLISDIDCGISD